MRLAFGPRWLRRAKTGSRTLPKSRVVRLKADATSDRAWLSAGLPTKRVGASDLQMIEVGVRIVRGQNAPAATSARGRARPERHDKNR
jgi:hypothetical protein